MNHSFRPRLRGNALWALTVCSLAGVLFTSCQNGFEPQVEDKTRQNAPLNAVTHKSSISAAEATQLNGQLEDLARSVAVTLADNQTATWLHKKAVERFDGCTNVLWRQLSQESAVPTLNKANKQGKPVEWSAAIMANHKGASTGIFASKQTLDAAIWRISEAVGGHTHLFWDRPELWDGRTAPLVGYTPVDVDGDHITELDAFDADGNKYRISEKTALTRPVVIITKNERTTKDGQLKNGYGKKGNADRNTIQLEEQGGSGGSGGAGGSGPGGNIGLRIDQVAFHSSHDSWPGSDPEFYAVTYDAANNRTKLSINFTSAKCDGYLKDLGVYINCPVDVSAIVYWAEEDDWLNFNDDILEAHSVNTTLFGITLTGYEPQVKYIR